MNKINILVAIDHGGYDGNLAGIGRDITYFLPYIDKTRYQAILVISREEGGVKRKLEGSGIKIIQLHRNKFDPRSITDFLTIIKNENIHLLHLFQYGSSNFGRIAAIVARIPVVLNANDLNYDYPWYQWIADRVLSRSVNYVIAVAESVKSACAKMRVIDSEKIIVIPHGVPSEHLRHPGQEKCLALRLHWGIPSDCNLVGTVTRLHTIKAVDVFLKAAHIVLQTLPESYFIIVGDGPLEAELKEFAKQLGIDQKVIFTGFQEDVAGLLSIFDIKAISSDAEGFSLALIEAMIMGKAIVATAVGGSGEIIRQDENGILVPAQQPDVLADKMLYLLRNPQLREKMGAVASRDGRKFTVEHQARMREGVYEKAVSHITI